VTLQPAVPAGEQEHPNQKDKKVSVDTKPQQKIEKRPLTTEKIPIAPSKHKKTV